MATSAPTSDELFREGIRAWESAVDVGVKMQEEYGQWLRQVFCDTGSLSDWCTKAQTAMTESIGRMQENIEEATRLVNQNAETCIRLVQKAMDARQPESTTEARARFAEWWGAALESMRTNTQAILGANSRVLSAWSDLAHKVNGEAAEKMAEMAKKATEQAGKMARTVTEQAREMAQQTSGNGA